MRWLLRLYPADWRRRYGDELDQLVEDVGLNPSVVFDIARSGVSERVSSLKGSFSGGDGMKLGPAWRHPTALAVLAFAVLAPTLLFTVGSLLTYNLGADTLRPPMDAINQFLFGRRWADLLLVVSPAIALLIATIPLVHLELKTGDSGREATVGIRLRAANVIVGLTALGIGGLLVWHIVFESVMELGA